MDTWSRSMETMLGWRRLWASGGCRGVRRSIVRKAGASSQTRERRRKKNFRKRARRILQASESCQGKLSPLCFRGALFHKRPLVLTRGDRVLTVIGGRAAFVHCCLGFIRLSSTCLPLDTKPDSSSHPLYHGLSARYSQIAFSQSRPCVHKSLCKLHWCLCILIFSLCFHMFTCRVVIEQIQVCT